MLVYLIMIAVILAVLLSVRIVGENNLGSSDKSLKMNRVAGIIIFAIIAFVAAFRYGVGTDFYAYYRTEIWVSNFKNGNYNSAGFTIFAIICQTVLGNINGAVTIGAALVTVAMFVYTITKNTDNLSISILLFIFIGCFTGMFNGVRQYLATAVLFFGHRFMIERKPIKWLIVVLIAASIHITAILMFFIYFVCNLKCSWKLVGVYFIIAVVLLFAYEPLFNLVGALKQDEIDTSDVYMSTQVNLLRVAVQCVPIVLLLFVNQDEINNDADTRFLFNICLLNAAIAIAAMNSAYLSRFWIYTSCFQILMYPKILSKMRGNNRLLFTTLLLLCYAIFWAYEVGNSASILNFRWIFNYL